MIIMHYESCRLGTPLARRNVTLMARGHPGPRWELAAPPVAMAQLPGKLKITTVKYKMETILFLFISSLGLGPAVTHQPWEMEQTVQAPVMTPFPARQLSPVSVSQE